ncbi:MAG: cytidylate kinase-like family protein [Faecalibacterium sp.]|jgi:cytidylate kinase|nr:cytidylate kinase-like family protein [Faecalibacterium sp.]
MKKILTIGRQFGAGGGEIGRRAAEALGIPYYDKDIILRTARVSANLTPEEVRRWDERVPSEFGFAQSLFDFYSRPLGDRLWDAQVEAIREMADRESCVIVGRNADYILREFDHCLRVFVHADFSWRMQRMAALMPDTAEEQLKADIRAADKARAGYCSRYTGQHYGDAANYDLTLCTSRLGVDKALELVLAAAEAL